MTATPGEATVPTSPTDPRFTLVLPGRVCGPGAGWTWIAQGWRIFARSAVMWIVALLLLFIISFAMMLVPFVGHIALQVLTPVFMAGLMLSAAAVETTGEFELGELFGGFKRNFGSLCVVGVIFFLGQVAIFLIFLAIAGFGTMAGIFAMIVSGDTEHATQALVGAGTGILLGSLFALLLYIPLLAAVWLAPPLVAMHGLGAVQAMLASLSACLRNLLPFLVYGIVMTIFAIIATIPILLGYFVWVPLAITSTYASYRGIFTEGEIEVAA
jgi:uncharacterized membrane protein